MASILESHLDEPLPVFSERSRRVVRHAYACSGRYYRAVLLLKYMSPTSRLYRAALHVVRSRRRAMYAAWRVEDALWESIHPKHNG